MYGPSMNLRTFFGIDIGAKYYYTQGEKPTLDIVANIGGENGINDDDTNITNFYSKYETELVTIYPGYRRDGRQN